MDEALTDFGLIDYGLVKWLHIVSSTLLFGTGLGTAFYMVCANATRDVHAIAVVARHVVLADWLFTATSVVLQPITGFYLALSAGFPLSSTWILRSLGLYGVAGAAWLPVVWFQMRDLARQADADGTALPPLYWRYAWIWGAARRPGLRERARDLLSDGREARVSGAEQFGYAAAGS
jgi:uncharacterized membrane protein